MRSRTALGLAVALLATACETKPIEPPTQALAPPSAELPAAYARFHGVWSGKWDETWDVTFVIDEVSGAGLRPATTTGRSMCPDPGTTKRPLAGSAAMR